MTTQGSGGSATGSGEGMLSDREETLAVSSRDENDVPQVVAGENIGRYVVLEVVGAGGMGTVVSAYDPKLDRKVAVKLLRSRKGSAQQEQRMVREAQALARLSDPRVVAVHDVGQFRGRLFIAMEFVEGRTLRQWVEDERPGWARTVELFAGAGRGLAAAHGAGLVHRDFKPDNVMVGDDGRVRVMDFGLAIVDVAPESRASNKTVEPTDSVARSYDSGQSGAALTVAGSVMGTPAYMAPEQLLGEDVDARADQFGFCVALYRALYDRAPFAGKAVAELTASVGAGRLRDPPSGRGVPSWVWSIVARGLSRRPADRYPGMAELLDDLERDPARRFRRGLLAVGGVGLLGAAWALPAATSGAQPCQGAAAHLAEVWNDDVRTRTESSMLGIGRKFAKDVWVRTERDVDAYAQGWVDEHTEACEATTVRGEQSSEVLDLRMACLQQAKMELRALVDVLVDADDTTVARAHRLVGDLRPLSACSDVAALRQGVVPPRPEQAETVRTIRELLATAKAERSAARLDASQRNVDQAVELAASVDYDPVAIEVNQAVAEQHLRAGRYAESEDVFRELMGMAAAARHWDGFRSATIGLVGLLGRELERGVEATKYTGLVLGLAKGDPAKEADAYNAVGTAYLAAGRPEEGEAAFRSALQAFERADDRQGMAGMRTNLGSALTNQGKFGAAEDFQRQALADWKELLGAGHPWVAAAHNNLSIALRKQENFDEAEQEQRLANQIREEALPAGHPELGQGVDNLAIILRQQGRIKESIEMHRQALEMLEESLGPDHPSYARGLYNLSSSLLDSGEQEEARSLLEKSLAILEPAVGVDHPHVVGIRLGYAVLLWEQAQSGWKEDPDTARTDARRALEIVEGHPEQADREQAIRAWLEAHAP